MALCNQLRVAMKKYFWDIIYVGTSTLKCCYNC